MPNEKPKDDLAAELAEAVRDCRAMYAVLHELQTIARATAAAGGSYISIPQLLAVCAPISGPPDRPNGYEAQIAALKEHIRGLEADVFVGAKIDTVEVTAHVVKLNAESVAMRGIIDEALLLLMDGECSECGYAGEEDNAHIDGCDVHALELRYKAFS